MDWIYHFLKTFPVLAEGDGTPRFSQPTLFKWFRDEQNANNPDGFGSEKRK